MVVAGVFLSCSVHVVGGFVASVSWLLLLYFSVFVAVTRGVICSLCRLAWLFRSCVASLVCADISLAASVPSSIPILSGFGLLSVSNECNVLMFLVEMGLYGFHLVYRYDIDTFLRLTLFLSCPSLFGCRTQLMLRECG